MNYQLLIIFIAAIIIYIIIRGFRGIPRDVTSLKRILSELLRRGYHHGFLVLKVPYSKKFMQIRKYINKPGEYGIELGFPNAKWSNEYFAMVEEFCIKENIDYVRRKDGVLEFIYIDFKQDISYAYNTVISLLNLLFNISETGKVVVMMEHGSPRDELIDR